MKCKEDTLRIATSRYQNAESVVASGLAPVGITAYPPRFRLRFEVVERIRELAPDRASLQDVRAGRMTDDEFAADYRARLGELGVDAIRTRLSDVAARAGAHGVVLLCFEDVHRGEVCHRRTLAEFLTEHSGEDVLELEEPK